METRIPDNEVFKLDGVEEKHADMLTDIFAHQREFMDFLGVPSLRENLEGQKEVNEFFKMLTRYSQDCATAISCETTELLDSIPWKHWKKSHKNIDLNNVRIEIVDLLHFVLELAIIWGLDSKSLHKLYRQKMQENYNRQQKGY